MWLFAVAMFPIQRHVLSSMVYSEAPRLEIELSDMEFAVRS